MQAPSTQLGAITFLGLLFQSLNQRRHFRQVFQRRHLFERGDRLTENAGAFALAFERHQQVIAETLFGRFFGNGLGEQSDGEIVFAALELHPAGGVRSGAAQYRGVWFRPRVTQA